MKWDTHMTWNDDWASASTVQAGPSGRALRPRRRAEPGEADVRRLPRARPSASPRPSTTQIEWGVWGGMTERERRAILRKRPNVISWRRLLEAAQPSRPLRPRPQVVVSA